MLIETLMEDCIEGEDDYRKRIAKEKSKRYTRDIKSITTLFIFT